MPETLILGLDIGGTKSTVLIGTSKGEVLQRVSFATEIAKGFDFSFGQLVAQAKRFLGDWQAKDNRAITAVGVSIGGPLDLQTGRLINPPHLPGWENLPLRDVLQQELKLPVYVEHDGNAGALAEWFFGAGVGLQSLVYLTAGTGFGAGLILDGRLYRGASSMAGEIGHVRVADDGPEMFGKRGVFESFCGGTGLAKFARQQNPALVQKLGPNFTVADLAQAARNGDSAALEVLAQSGRYLGRALALLADILNPQMIVVGSLGLRLGEMWLQPAMQEFEQEALSPAFNVCRVVTSQLGENIQDIAALCAAIYPLRQENKLE